jgi:hypothetical protein
MKSDTLLFAMIASAVWFGLLSGKRLLPAALCAGLAYSAVAAVFVILQGRLSIVAYLPSLLIDFAVAALLTAVLGGVRLGFTRLSRRTPQAEGEKRT